MNEALALWVCHRSKEINVSEDIDPKITRDIAIPIGRNSQGHLMVTRIQGTDERPVKAMLGELRPLQDGVPINGEVVKLTPCEDAPHLDVETVIEDPYKDLREKASSKSGSGKAYSFPSTKYQDNWDRIFGQTSKPSEVN